MLRADTREGVPQHDLTDGSEGRTLASLLDEFAALRQANLSDLATLRLTNSDLARRGRHPELGTVTLRQILATWVAHDVDHVMQISRVMAGQYSDEVGPRRAYLRIISGAPGLIEECPCA